MTTREQIIVLGDELIREKGFHGFSYADIARSLGVKNASIHYYFPTKTDLGVAILQRQLDNLHQLKILHTQQPCTVQLQQVIALYARWYQQRTVCLVGALGATFGSLDGGLQAVLQQFSTHFLQYVTEILEEGRKQNIFHFFAPPEVKALMVITNLIGALQLSRLNGAGVFDTVTENIIAELTT